MRNRNLAASHEFGGLAGHRGHSRLSENFRHAIALIGLDLRGEPGHRRAAGQGVIGAELQISRSQSRNVGRQRVLHGPCAPASRCNGVGHAQLFHHASLHLRDRHLQHDLIAPPQGHGVHHPANGHAARILAEETFGQILRHLRVCGRISLANQNDGVFNGFRGDGGFGHRDAENLFQLCDVAANGNLEFGDPDPLRVQRINRRLTRRRRDQIELAGGTDNGADHLGIGHQHLGGVARKIHDDRLPDAQMDVGPGSIGRLVHFRRGARGIRSHAGGECAGKAQAQKSRAHRARKMLGPDMHGTAPGSRGDGHDEVSAGQPGSPRRNE